MVGGAVGSDGRGAGRGAAALNGMGRQGMARGAEGRPVRRIMRAGAAPHEGLHQLTMRAIETTHTVRGPSAFRKNSFLQGG